MEALKMVQKRLNILLVHEEYPQEKNYGGIATYQNNLSVALTNLGHKVTVIGATNKQKIFRKEKGNIQYIGIPKQKNLAYDLKEELNFQKRVASVINSLNRIDIIEVPEWGATLHYFMEYQQKFKNIPIITKLHTPLFVWQEANVAKIPEMYLKTMTKWEHSQIVNSSAVFSCTKDLLNKVEKKYRCDLSGKVIYNPMLDINDEPHNINESLNNILFVGSLEARKGVFELADELLLLPTNFRSNIKITFLGDDTNRNRFNCSTKMLLTNKLSGKINFEFIGHVEHEFVNDYMQVADLLVVPSRYDNLPYVVLEGLNNGIPVITSSGGGISEIIENEVDGLKFDLQKKGDLAKTILKINDKKSRKKYSIAGREKIKNFFDGELIAKQQVQAYYEILERCTC